MVLIDLVGRRFGRLTVAARGNSHGKQIHWLCNCACGKSVSVRGSHLRLGKIESCGCLRDELARERMRGNVLSRRDIAGQRFHRLTALRWNGSSRRGMSYWQCVCDCGKEKAVSLSSLHCGTTKSCGCLSDESNRSRVPNNYKVLSGCYGMLTVLGQAEVRGRWLCRCECGKHTCVPSWRLTSGKTKSCGCLRISRHVKPSLTKQVLNDAYICNLFGVKELPQVVIDAKREHVRVKRLLKELSNGNQNA